MFEKVSSQVKPRSQKCFAVSARRKASLRRWPERPKVCCTSFMVEEMKEKMVTAAAVLLPSGLCVLLSCFFFAFPSLPRPVSRSGDACWPPSGHAHAVVAFAPPTFTSVFLASPLQIQSVPGHTRSHVATHPHGHGNPEPWCGHVRRRPGGGGGKRERERGEKNGRDSNSTNSTEALTVTREAVSALVG